MTRRDLLKLGALASASTLLSRAVAQSSSTAAGSVAQPIAPAAGVARAEKPLNILILGGTGFTGPHQVRYALARGHKLTLFNRGRRPKDWPGEVEELTGDRETGDLKALEGTRTWDVCIDNPTSVPHWVRDVGRVLQGRVGQYVYISSLSAYANTVTPGMTEDAPLAEYTGADIMKETRATLLANMNLYGPLKAGCEREAEKWFPGITTIIRPTLIVGPGDETDRLTYWPVRVARGDEVLAPPASDPIQIIDARDLAEWTIRLSEQRAFGAFNGVGPDYELTSAEMLHGIHAALGGKVEFAFVDQAFVEAQRIRAWSEFPAWVPGGGDTAGFSRVSGAKSQAAGLTYRPLATTVVDLMAWFRALPAERQAALRAGLKPERETELLRVWHTRAKAKG